VNTVPLEKAVGRALCHDLTRIVPGEMKGAQFKKGYIIKEEDLPMLRSMGKLNIYTMERKAGMVHEEEAAEALAALCRGPLTLQSECKEGKIELFAQEDGFFDVDVEAVNKINALGNLAVVTRRPFTAVKKGWKLAAVKAIPLFAPEKLLSRAASIAKNGPLCSVLPFTVKNACVITTGSETASGLVKDEFTPVLTSKLEAFGIKTIFSVKTGDSTESILKAVNDGRAALKEAAGGGLILCSGGMSVDPDDKTPAAIKKTGARVVIYGVPVFPGAMFMLSYLDGGVPLAGIPACAMFCKTTVFDAALPALAAGKRLKRKDFTRMGAGGLCLNCPQCVFPACSFASL
jgi:molybdopterin biosynthesis enzyme